MGRSCNGLAFEEGEGVLQQEHIVLPFSRYAVRFSGESQGFLCLPW